MASWTRRRNQIEGQILAVHQAGRGDLHGGADDVDLRPLRDAEQLHTFWLKGAGVLPVQIVPVPLVPRLLAELTLAGVARSN